MFHLYGWIHAATDSTTDPLFTNAGAFIASLEATVAEFELGHGINILNKGGSSVLQLCFVQNRDRGDSTKCLDFLARLGSFAPLSYGVIYIQDDDVDNLMRRIVMRRGNIVETSDDLFSPIVPTIEDPL